MGDKELATLSTLPVELVANILERLLETNTLRWASYDDLLPITQTSKHIRQVALSTPSLWQTIQIHDRPSSFNLAKLFLARSGNHKLDVSIRVLKRMELKINGLLAMLQYAAHRIRRLSMTLSFVGAGQWETWWNAMKDVDFSVIESLEFDLWAREGVSNYNAPLQNAIPLPAATSPLRSLSLGHVSPALGSPVLANLTQLKLVASSFWGWPYAQLFDLLRGTVALEELELRGVGLDESRGSYHAHELPPIARLTLPNLRRLTFVAVENNMVAQALTNLTAPNLEAVSLETPRQLRSDVVFKWNEIPSASMTPLPSVRSLFVTDRPMPASLHQDQFAMFLSRIFPRIEEMEIVALGCRPLLTTWAEHFDVAPNGWRDLRSLVLEYEDFKCVGSPQEILRETLRFLDVRRKVPENAPLEWVQIGVCEECMWTVKDALLNGMKRVVRSKEDLQIVRVCH